MAGFTCALVGAVASLIPIVFWGAPPLGMLGLVLGIIGRRRATEKPEVGRRTMATWAIALGILAIGIGILGIAIADDAFP